MSEIQQTRYDRMVRRVAGIIGPGSKVGEVISELFPMIDVENPPAELLLLGGTQLGMGGNTLITGALNFGRIQVQNPVDSNHIITVTRVVLATNVAQILRGTVTNVLHPSVLGVSRQRDTRKDVLERPVGRIGQDAAPASFTTATVSLQVPADFPLQIEDQNALAVLAPGTAYEWGTGQVDTTFSCFYFWRERPAEPSELSL